MTELIFRDAAPDRWGRRVIENKLRKAGPLPESEYLAHAGHNRTGAIDFRNSIHTPEPDNGLAQLLDLAYLKEAAERIDLGEAIPARLDGISMQVRHGGRSTQSHRGSPRQTMAAKFALNSDSFCIPGWNATLKLAAAAGLAVNSEVRLKTLAKTVRSC